MSKSLSRALRESHAQGGRRRQTSGSGKETRAQEMPQASGLAQVVMARAVAVPIRVGHQIGLSTVPSLRLALFQPSTLPFPLNYCL